MSEPHSHCATCECGDVLEYTTADLAAARLAGEMEMREAVLQLVTRRLSGLDGHEMFCETHNDVSAAGQPAKIPGPCDCLVSKIGSLTLSPSSQQALERHDALVRLDEAKWWEHLVGNLKPEHSIDHDPDCIYCQRIAEHEKAAGGLARASQPPEGSK